MRKRVSVLICEPNKLYSGLMSDAFHSVRHRIRVVAHASSTSEIIDALRDAHPEVAVININLKDGLLAGIRVLPNIRKISPVTRTLLVLESSVPELVVEAFSLGADGVFCQNQPFEVLCRSVEAISRGQIWASTAELRYVLEAFVKSSKRRKLDPRAESRMTRSESAVVHLAAAGLSNREIATQLGLAEHTVKNYLYRVFDKLGVSNRVELLLSCLDQEEASHEVETVGTQEAASHSAEKRSQHGDAEKQIRNATRKASVPVGMPPSAAAPVISSTVAEGNSAATKGRAIF
jgi:DNA-binding NarL/FixJ family response regulator